MYRDGVIGTNLCARAIWKFESLNSMKLTSFFLRKKNWDGKALVLNKREGLIPFYVGIEISSKCNPES